MKKCPFCAEQIQGEAIKCRWCDTFLIPRDQVGEQAHALRFSACPHEEPRTPNGGDASPSPEARSLDLAGIAGLTDRRTTGPTRRTLYAALALLLTVGAAASAVRGGGGSAQRPAPERSPAVVASPASSTVVPVPEVSVTPGEPAVSGSEVADLHPPEASEFGYYAGTWSGPHRGETTSVVIDPTTERFAYISGSINISGTYEMFDAEALLILIPDVNDRASVAYVTLKSGGEALLFTSDDCGPWDLNCGVLLYREAYFEP